jgi:site-specific DNA-adenine methylase
VPILLGVRTKISEYLEPCAFGASVFLAMPRVGREVLGDINPDVVALWRVLSDAESAGELARRLADVPYSRSAFDAAKYESSGTGIEQAARFLIRCRLSRGGLCRDFAWSERQRGGRSGDEKAWDTFRSYEEFAVV